MNCKFFRSASGMLTIVLFMAAAVSAVIGDQMQAREKQEQDVQRQMQAQQAEIERANREIQQLKAQ